MNGPDDELLCAYCGQLIIDRPFVIADEQYFHFKCYELMELERWEDEGGASR